jgi:hypothetical protein
MDLLNPMQPLSPLGMDSMTIPMMPGVIALTHPSTCSFLQEEEASL